MELSAGDVTNDPAQGLVPFHTMSPYYFERRSAASATFDASLTVPFNRYPIGANAEDLNRANLLRLLIPIKSPVTRLREDAVFNVEQIGIILKINGHAFAVTNPPIKGLLARRLYEVVSYRYLDVRVSLPKGLIQIP